MPFLYLLCFGGIALPFDYFEHSMKSWLFNVNFSEAAKKITGIPACDFPYSRRSGSLSPREWRSAQRI
jgi:hypothetical protein